MSEIRKFVTYIYQYEKAVRRHNVGFARVEIRDHQCRMQIQMKAYPQTEKTIPIYLFVKKGEDMVGIKIDEIPASPSGISKRMEIDAEHVGGSNFTMNDVIGMRFGSGKTYLGSIWVDDVTELKLGRILDREEPRQEEPRQEEPRQEEPKREESRQEGPKREEPERIKQEEERMEEPEQSQQEPFQKEQSRMQSMEEQKVEAMYNWQGEKFRKEPGENFREKFREDRREDRREDFREDWREDQREDFRERFREDRREDRREDHREDFREDHREDRREDFRERFREDKREEPRWNSNLLKTEEVNTVKKRPTELFANREYWKENLNGKMIYCYRIRINEIKYLPQKYWYLGNNNFLLHGFFQYGYVVYGESEDNTVHLIGAPGVFRNQENVAATIFGFPEFIPEKKTEQLTGQFGYWYRCQEE